MGTKAFEAGDRVRVIASTFSSENGEKAEVIGTVRSVDKDRRRTDPYYIYYVELPGEEKLIDFEYRELELASSL